ncbi:pre-peptidase C-terminal domain-containing protein [Massilia sp. BJB1822]|uniref:pre-peptidase C-terminal domain-containing protein n=1 Tax=Massilia sp. BJB1822 TaxID=2744470 RepID=UPI0015947F86|nr:pre-peptidase C-terminal domain-containing protein [Massilia sp. BJB1822]NVD97787.1 IPT/TIG domain-containing protein [Massilia sp. BJB1822]
MRTLLAALAICAAGGMAAAGEVRYVYDETGRLVQVIAPDGSSVEYRYDAVGNIASVKKLSEATLAITEFSPNSGGAGIPVRIYGSGFDPSPAANTVRFNGAQAQVVSASKTELSVTVPAGATSGKISVSNANGTASSVQDFKIGNQLAPVITSFSPNIGTRGTAVTINGSNFAADRAGNKASFGNMLGNVSSAAVDKLVATVPGAGASGKIAVTTANGRGLSSEDFYAVPTGVNVADIEYTGRLQVGAPPQAVNIVNPGKKALLLFDGTPRDLLTLVSSGGNFASSVNISAYRNDGTSFHSAGLTAASAVDLPALPAGGTYTLILSPGSTDKGKIDLQLKSEARGALVLDGDALPVTLTPGQNGRYTFTGRAGQGVGLGYLNVATVPASQGIYYRVFNPDGTQLFSDSWSNSNSDTLPLLPVNGNYALQVDPSGIASASLQLIASSDLTGQLVADGPALTFNTSRVGQNGRYAFSGTAGQKFWLTFSNAAFAAGVSVRVLKPDGSALESSSVSTGVSNLDIQALPVAGTYTVLIDPSGLTIGKVDIQLKSVPADKTGTIEINGAALPLELAIHQKAAITFSGTAGQRLGLGYTGVSTLPANQSIYYTVYKPDGTQLSNDSWTTNNSNNLPALPVTGDYKIAVYSNNISASLNTTLTLSADIAGALEADGPTVTHNSDRVGQNGRYTFSGTAGQKFWLTFSNGSFASSVNVNVLKPDGSSLVSGSVAKSSVDLDIPALPVAGTYTVFIDPPGIITGKVDLQLKGVPADRTGTIEIDGAPLALDLAVHQKAAITFSGTAGQRLGLGYTGVATVPVNQNIYYTVYKPDGTQLSSDSWTTNNSNNLPALPVAGEYKIAVYSNNVSASLKTTLTLSADLAAVLEADGPTVTHNSDRVGQNGRYTFSGSVGQKLWVTLSNGSFASGVSISVLKPDGSALVSSSVSKSVVNFDIPALPVAGTYTVLVDPSGIVTGKVDIQLKNVPADKTGTIEINGASLPLDLAIHQKALISFTGAAGQRLGLGYTNVATVPASQSITYTVLKPDGSQLFSDSWSNSNSNNLPVLPVAGEYKISIASPNIAASASLVLTASADIAGVLTVDAAPLTFITARVGQNGRFTFSGEAGQKLWLTLANGNFPSSVSVSVLKPDGSALVSTSVSTSVNNLDIPALPAAGTYTVFIDPSGIVTGKVDVQLKGVPADQVIPIAVDGSPVALDMAVHQRATLSFDGVAGQRLGLGYTNMSTVPASQSIYYTVYKPDGSQLFSDSWNSNNSNNLPVLPVSGTYKIAVYASNIAASFKVTVGLSADLPGALEADGPALTFNTSRVGQNGRFTFNGTAGKKYWLTFSNGALTAGISVSILKPDGSSLTSTSASNSTSYFDIPVLPADGVYSIFLDPSGVTVGKVDVQLKSVPADYEAALAIDGTPVALDLAVHQRAVLSFNGSAGQRLGAGYTGLSTVPASQSVYFTVFKPDGAQLFSDSWSSNNSNNWPALPVGGTYKLIVYGAALNSAVKATVTLSADAVGVLTPGAAPLQFLSTRPGQNARYSFSGDVGQRLWLTYSGATFPSGASIYVYKPDGTSLVSTSSSNTTELDLPVLPVAGTYTVFIDPAAVSVGQANVQLRAVPADSTAAIAIDGAPVALDLQLHQKAVLSFDGAAGQPLGLGYTGYATVPANQSINYRVLKPDGSQLFSGSWSNNNSNDLPALPVGGTYTVHVQPPATATAKVTVSLSADVPGTLVQGGAAVRFASSRVGQNGRFTFAGTAGQTGSLQFSGGTFPSSASIYVYKPDGSNLTSISVSTSGTLNLPALPVAGTYTVFINPSAATTGQVDIQLK